MGKRGLVALLSMSSWCLVIDVWLFLAVPWVCLQFVIVVFPDHTHLLFSHICNKYRKFYAMSQVNIYAAQFYICKKVGFCPQILNINLKTTDYASLFDGLCEFPIWITPINLKIRKC